MEPVAEAIWRGLGHAAVVTLNGVEPFDLRGSGFQWFSVAGVSEANRAQRIAEALPRVDAMIENECARANVSRERTAIVGFSQGAIMALHLAAASQRPPRSIVSWAGRVASPIQCTHNSRPSILLSHGISDALIPASELELAAAKLRGIGCSVETELVADHGHSVHQHQVESSIRFLSSYLPASLRRD
jgi:phospholipase/carboxylesterase